MCCGVGLPFLIVVASEQTKANVELEKKLENTESARAEAMRKLSDMNQSYVWSMLLEERSRKVFKNWKRSERRL